MKRLGNDPWATFRYKAFISYAHADQEFADWLEERLGAFDIPNELRGMWTPVGPVPANIRPVFRDRTNLSASHDLSEELKAKLAESATLIVICTPASAKSQWVQAEIEHFRSLGRGDRIFSIIADGVPRGEGDTNCFPAPFLTDEPLAANAREPEQGGEGRDSALIKVIAGMVRVDPTELKSKENAILVARARNARRLAMIFGGVAVAALLSAIFAFTQMLRANHSINVAQHTIDGVLETLESERMKEVWGFQRVEPDMLDRLLQLQRELGGSRQRGAEVQATVLMRQAGLENMRGNIEQSIELNHASYSEIVPVALRPNATQAQRALALKATYRYYFALGALSRVDEQGRILEETQPILRAAVGGELPEEGRRWAAFWLDNQRGYLTGRQEYDAALRASTEAQQIVTVPDMASASVDQRLDYALIVNSRAFTLRAMDRQDEARRADDESCAMVQALIAEAPSHRDVMRMHLYCTFARAERAYQQRDRDGSLAAVREAMMMADTPARVGAEGATFRAAIATGHYRVGQVRQWIDRDPDAALLSYASALRIWSEIYQSNTLELGDFDTLEDTFIEYSNTLAEIERARSGETYLQAQHAQQILAMFNSFRTCGERLGAVSTCGKVTMRAARAAADRMFALGRGAEVVEPLRVAATLSRQLETDQWYRRYSQTFAESCAFRRDVGRALLLANRPSEAVQPFREAIEACRPFMDQHDYDIYIRSAVWGSYLYLSRAQIALQQPQAARQSLAACYAIYGANCYADYADMLERGVGGNVDLALAQQVRAQRAYTNLRRFTAQARTPGGVVTRPVELFVFERPPNFAYQGVDDSVRWVRVNQGLEVPEEAAQAFRTLERVARENNASFPDLAAAMVQVANSSRATEQAGAQ